MSQELLQSRLHDFLLSGRIANVGKVIHAGRTTVGPDVSVTELQHLLHSETNKLLVDHHGYSAADIVARSLACREELEALQVHEDHDRISDLSGKVEELEKEREHFQRALNMAGAGFWDWDLDTGHWDASPQFHAILEQEPGSIKTYESYLSLVHEEDREELSLTVNNALAERSAYQVSYRVVLGNGKVRHFREDGRLLSDENDPADRLFAVVCDDTERQIALAERQGALQQVMSLAYNDPVTMLPNRKFLMSELQQKLMEAERENHMAGAMVINLDGFRDFNEARGQMFGDLLLKEVGIRLKNICGEVGSVACLGGDEFVVITGDAVHVDDLAVLATETLHSLVEPVVIDGHTVHMTASIGIAVFPTDATTPINLLQMSQMAVTRAREDGGNAYAYFNEEMAASVHEQAMIRGALVPALENSEFTLNYQPKVSIETGDVIGFEALIRWTSPSLGFISPAAFIPIAEETPFIQQLGHWIVETVCGHHKQWSSEGYTVPPIAINVAGPQLRAGFAGSVEKILSDYGLDSENIHMELTETSLIKNLKSTVPLVHDLRNIGIDLSIDDFGTGYSSLSYLQMFPVDALKIDQSFVQRLAEEQGSKSIVEATIALAHSLGLRVIAEGVETLEQLTMLRDLDCDEIQGYYFSRPIPADDVPDLLSSNPNLWSVKSMAG